MRNAAFLLAFRLCHSCTLYGKNSIVDRLLICCGKANREAVGLIVVALWPDEGTVEEQVASVDTGVSAGRPEVAA